ncbi:serine/threonine protein kinase [Chitiniphilus eburneus]|uniref:HDOD domain-containing protein n=1 Tax=Chitiniphilus eburneus TaxID=2571148 RepID=A0A4U0QJM4_9NEIS|nr:serine/threonine protein kinase [Chitiniphilus eburneus]TJZ76264.1 HDOD domain-containing protein [Chitiniphilus eburneus]
MAETLQKRFEIVRTLGDGAQGKVYLARDAKLGRQVALKALRQGRAAGMEEARLASRLQHPNIVTLFDAFEAQGQSWLVFEYVEGETLGALLKREGPLPPTRAVELASGILQGLICAHGQGVIHRDIKPQNVMVDGAGRPRIMDFGIAALRGAKVDLSGTASYMAPEMLKSLPAEAQADLFGVGMTLYEMLTGRTAAEGDSTIAILYHILNNPFTPPSRFKADIDEKLDHLVMVSLFKEPRERYTDADAMFDALRTWQGHHDERAEGESATGSSTVEFLLRRMRHTADFPALSQAISAINKISGDDAERLQVLSEVILKDFSLTNKLLRIVNSATYSQFGGTISTVSRAIVILGFDAIRNLAITLLLFEHMHNKAQAVTLRESVLRAFFSGLLCRGIGKRIGTRDAEEALICGMFHHLGQLLTLYYFHEESVEIGKRVEGGMTVEVAAKQVLGLGYSDLGIGVAQHWSFPERIVNSMRPLPPGPLREPQNNLERLRQYTNLGADMQQLVGSSAREAPRMQAALVERYGRPLGISSRDIDELMRETADHFISYLSVIGVNHSGSEFMRQLRRAHASPLTAGGPEAFEDMLDRATLDAPFEATEQAQPAEVLAAGVQDITNTLVGDFKLNDLLRMILETMYRAIGFERVIFATRDTKRPVIQGRFGFGEGIGALVGGFQIDVGPVVDVFQVAMARNADILIEDINAESIHDRVPEWYRRLVPSCTFIVFPLKLDQRVIGCFYGDMREAGSLKLSHNELNLLKTLRNQALLAIRTKQVGG